MMCRRIFPTYAYLYESRIHSAAGYSLTAVLNRSMYLHTESELPTKISELRDVALGGVTKAKMCTFMDLLNSQEASVRGKYSACGYLAFSNDLASARGQGRGVTKLACFCVGYRENLASADTGR
jgi:hypothetical protein